MDDEKVCDIGHVHFAALPTCPWCDFGYVDRLYGMKESA